MANPDAYQPLNPRRKEIRIATLLPGKPNSLIKCQLEIVFLDLVDMNYEALSYEWGDEAGQKSILLQGKDFKVRNNLWQFLSVLRSETERRVFWIDAICINQASSNDSDEKKQQIPLMSDIYRKASMVRAWLGPQGEGSDVVFRFASSIERWSAPFEGKVLVPATRGPITRSISGHLLFQFLEALFLKTMEQYPEQEERINLANSITRLSERSYWSRIWSVQEVLLGRQVLFHCGQDVTRAVSLYYALHYNDSSSMVPPIYKLPKSHQSQILKRRFAALHGTGEHKLFDLLEMCKGSQCSLVHDRLYGVLGVTTDIPPGLISIQYTDSIIKVKFDLIHAVFGHWSREKEAPYGFNQLMDLFDDAFKDNLGP